MAILSREAEIQTELLNVYEMLISTKDIVYSELISLRKNFSKVCDTNICSGYRHEKEWLHITSSHQEKFLEYDTYCLVVDIVNDFKDLNGQFPDYLDMYETLSQVMLRLANQEQYELAAVLKPWVDRIKTVLIENN